MTDGDEAPPAGALVVVDAANVVGSRPDGWWRDRAGAARRLVGQLAAGMAGMAGAEELTVVLEGAAKAGVAADDTGPLRVVHASGDGDDEVVAVVRGALEHRPARAVVVVTSDRELRRRVEELGALTHGPGWLRRRI
jgi:hypothetical protein